MSVGARIAIVGSLVALLGFGDARPGEAQNYPPPTPTFVPPTPPRTPPPAPPRTPPRATPRETAPPSCFVAQGEVDGEFVIGRVEYQGELLAQGSQHCAPPFGEVDISIESERVFLGTLVAFEDGSFRGTFTLPASVLPGPHEVIADIEQRGELRRPMEVLDTTATVPGAQEVRPGTGAGGVLPRTGSGIALLILWALVLIGLGTLLVMSAMRYGGRLAPVRALARLRPNRDAPLALPPPEVPYVDTSRFVPYRSRLPTVGRPGGSNGRPRWNTDRPSDPPTDRPTLTEWDVAHRSQRPS